MPQFVQTEQQKEVIESLVQDLPAYRKKMRMSQAERERLENITGGNE